MNRVLGALAALPMLAAVVGGPAALPTTAVEPAAAGTIVETAPDQTTPHVLDGVVRTVARVGDRIVLGGRFTQVREEGNAAVLTRTNLVAFDPTTGVVDKTFAPDPDGTVHTLEAGPGGTVYVGGEFDRIGGVERPKLALLRLSDGNVVSSFGPDGVTGKVKDLALRDGRLWVAGAFTHIDGRRQPALATLSPTTGDLDRYMSLRVSETHRGGATGVSNIDLSDDGDRLVAVGNFRRVDGKRRQQLVVLRTDGPSAQLTSFRTRFLESRCRKPYHSYVEDVAFSPDASFFVVGTTGGRRGTLSPCDATMRFETDAVGPDAPYSWLAKTGGDSIYGVAVSDSVVYVGGHPRYQNNSGGDNDAGPGAVSRPDVAALDPDNGLPLSWRPTQQRGGGQGINRLFLDQLGLWLGSDADRFDGQVRSRIVLLPDQGDVVPEYEAPSELSKIYLAGVADGSGSPLVSRAREGRGFGSDVDEPAGDVPWSELTGAFLLDGRLYTASPTDGLQRRTFDGASYGPVVAVNTSDQIVPLTSWHADMAKMTAMFFDRGRLYFTKAGRDRLYYRYFSPESDVVGVDRRVASAGVRGLDLSTVQGMALIGGQLYWTTPSGALKRVQWSTGDRAGRPVAGTVRRVSSPKRDGLSWRAGELLAPDPS